MSPISDEDRESIINIFNYYVENSFAAYPETKLPYEAFDIFLQMSQGYPTATVKDNYGKPIGFGLLRSHNPMATFSQTAEITYFISPEHTGKGVGKKLLRHLEKEGKKRSIDFHRKNGFIECGCFKSVGRKKGRIFDTVWMQKML
ncbi:MAG: N-acetyltransferase family protein [Desulfobacterales bacterium]